MRILFLVIALLTGFMAEARDFGVIGQTYVIAEEDFLKYIEQKIQALQANGQWQKLEEQFKKQVVAHLERPAAIQNLPRAQEDKTYEYDPSIAAPYDVWDTQGNLIVKKGAVINPLERISLSSTLLFFNADDNEQCAWALQLASKQKNVKLILTSGSLKSATHYFKQAVYFDLNGFLVNKFQIKALPAQIQQKGHRLQIQEVKL